MHGCHANRSSTHLDIMKGNILHCGHDCISVVSWREKNVSSFEYLLAKPSSALWVSAWSSQSPQLHADQRGRQTTPPKGELYSQFPWHLMRTLVNLYFASLPKFLVRYATNQWPLWFFVLFVFLVWDFVCLLFGWFCDWWNHIRIQGRVSWQSQVVDLR